MKENVEYDSNLMPKKLNTTPWIIVNIDGHESVRPRNELGRSMMMMGASPSVEGTKEYFKQIGLTP